MDWDGFHHDLRNTGNLATKLDQGGDEVVPPDPIPTAVEAGACQCQLGRRSATVPGVFAALLLICLTIIRRRARTQSQ
jgi:hypothetical protein